ncbi:DUF1206 domain-containing protein [uncultured Phenylobacterium sp.]|uniref:DUF1206 domain-containing protein n=1 Tax=uncultured Phenylobacterium sp. TaxID=349273 RepID=UPI0025D8CABB|nr:DUF1206 domain-containing protein [uncultured Phenylobacterium sp.]
MTSRGRAFPTTAWLGAPLARLQRRFEAHPWTAVLEAAARAGYLARGAVYLSVGVIALLAALRLSPRAEGAVGALQAWGEWPAGLALIWLVGVGLYGFAGWRALQAIFDVDRCGHTARGLANRAGQAVSGIAYAGLAISVFGLLDAMEDLHEPDDQAATGALVARVLDLPFGPLIVLGMGLFILASGVGSVVRASLDHFRRNLDCEPQTRAWAGSLARIGYFGRGVALLPAGLLLASAGLHARASDARGLGGALELLITWPFGRTMLGLTAAGLIAFGLFAVVEACLRPMRLARALPQVD